MKHLSRILLLFCFLFILSCKSLLSQLSFGKTRLINDNWVFSLKDDSSASNPDYNDRNWRSLDLPHDWSIEYPLSPSLASCTGYLPGGIGWYRKRVEIPADMAGKKVFLCFEGVYNRSTVYINGKKLGHRPNGYVTFSYDITPFVRFGERNIIAVRVDHSRYADSRWYTGSGIYRNVWLITSEKVHFDTWGVTYKTISVSKTEAIMRVSAVVSNETTVPAGCTFEVKLTDQTGQVVANRSSGKDIQGNSKAEFTSDLKIKNPRLWSTESPELYTLTCTVKQGKNIIDESKIIAGIRTLEFNADKGFALNGKWMKMKGVCIHHDAGVLGSAVPLQVWERRLKALKEIGCNAIRMSHNLQAPGLYDLCDKMGFLVIDEGFDEFEFPKKKWLKGWNMGEPGFDGTFDFFEEWSSRDVEAMVLRDRNHPSIVMWSIGNEVDYPNDPYSHPILNGTQFSQPVSGGYDPSRPNAERLGPIGKRLSGVIRAIDTSRPVTGALAGVIMTNETDYPKYLDVVGYNYTENRYATDHSKYPSRIIYGSENGHGYDSWKAVRDNVFIFGQFVWTGIDYLGESRQWPSRGFNSGMIDLAGFIKPRGYFRMAMWSEKPAIYIGTYPLDRRTRRGLSDSALPVWNYNSNDTIRVVCYTNCKQVQLKLNGDAIGLPKSFDDNSGIISWDLPFKPGKLEVTGLENGITKAEYSIQTSGRPAVIKAVADRNKAGIDKDIIQIIVSIVDNNGVPVEIADDEITCNISGPVKLLGLENANNTDMGDYRDNVQRVYHGRLIAYIQTKGQPGKAGITFTSPWLEPAKVDITIENQEPGK